MCWVSATATHWSIIYTRTTASTTSGIDEICQSAWERTSRSVDCLSAALAMTSSRFIRSAARLAMKVRKFAFLLSLSLLCEEREHFREEVLGKSFEIPFSFSTSTISPIFRSHYGTNSSFLLSRVGSFFSFMPVKEMPGTNIENDFCNFICLNISSFCFSFIISPTRICMSRLVDGKWYNIYHRSSRRNQAWRLH